MQNTLFFVFVYSGCLFRFLNNLLSDCLRINFKAQNKIKIEIEHFLHGAFRQSYKVLKFHISRLCLIVASEYIKCFISIFIGRLFLILGQSSVPFSHINIKKLFSLFLPSIREINLNILSS